MRWIVVLALGALAGCLQSQLTPCGDVWCLEGTTCVANALCASSDQIAACDGVAEGETCSVNGGIGLCDRGVCVPIGCGNSIVDPDETCDDGNTASGDGCRADCRKVEICSDAIVDQGEACDDGNLNAADGCDACVATEWRATAVIGGNANATKVGLASPLAVAVDRRGNLYIVDTNNSRIRRVDATGVVTTAAGTGTDGYSGDGGPATSAQLSQPASVTVDGLGNLFIADTKNQRIRRVDGTGVITTVAGTGTFGFSGDAGAATTAQLNYPSGVAVDGLGNLYIADRANNRIRQVDTAGVITTIAGTGVSGSGGDGGLATNGQLSAPQGVAIDGLGNFYVADVSNQRIRRVDANGIITTVAGTGVPGFTSDGGAATSAQLFEPYGVAVDSLGNLYIADRNNQRVRRVDAMGIITTRAGSGTAGFGGDGAAATSGLLDGPTGVAVDGLGNLYIADQQNHRIRRVDPSGVIATIVGAGTPGDSGDDSAATSATLSFPSGVAVAGGNIYIAETANHRIRRIDAGGVITTVAGTGVSGSSGDGALATSGRLSSPSSIALDSAGSMYIADRGNHRIRRVSATGIMTTVAGTGAVGFSGDSGAAISAQLSLPSGVAVDGAGHLFIADTGNQRIRKVDAITGVISTLAGTGVAGFNTDGPAAGAQLNYPAGVAVDGLGNLYVADTVNNRVRRIDTTGTITTLPVSAQLSSPTGISVALGNVYIADTANHRIRRVDAMGQITTVAGSGLQGRLGDGSPAASAQLSSPKGVAVDALGNIYVADFNSQCVRRIDTSGVMTTAAGLIDPERMGPLAQARLADPRALVLATPFTLVAGGTSGTVQAARTGPAWLEVGVGRYPQIDATGTFARFRDQNFGSVSGVAYDAASGLIYLTESSSNRLHVVTLVDLDDESTWTIATLSNAAGTPGFADGAAQAAQFREPTGLYFDAAARQLYVADTGNHVVRAIDLSSGIMSATVRTIAGTPATLGYFGDDVTIAAAALLYAPEAITRCANGDLFIADTGNHRVRRVAAGTNMISTVLGVGVAASSGEGFPATTFPVHAPLGLACDAIGNLFVTSTTTVRLVPANASGVVDGTGEVQTIYGGPPYETFPASVTTCLTGLAVVDSSKVQVVDSCTGLLVELRREPVVP
jgi:cysteine-rich repeat protein